MLPPIFTVGRVATPYMPLVDLEAVEHRLDLSAQLVHCIMGTLALDPGPKSSTKLRFLPSTNGGATILPAPLFSLFLARWHRY